MIEFLGISVGQQALVLGLVTGLTYAAFAAGFVLIYRATGCSTSPTARSEPLARPYSCCCWRSTA